MHLMALLLAFAPGCTATPGGRDMTRRVVVEAADRYRHPCVLHAPWRILTS